MAPQDGSLAVGALWYKTILTNSVICPNYAGQYYEKPEGMNASIDELVWSVVLNPSAPNGPYSITTYSAGKTSATLEQNLLPGLNLGYSGDTIASGQQSIVMKDGSGTVVMSASNGACVSDGCPDTIYNCNYQVVPLVTGTQKSSCTPLPLTDLLTSSSPVCSMTYTTSDDTSIPVAATTIRNTWLYSGAADYLDNFLDQKDLDDWVLSFFETVINGGNSPGGSVYDCHDITGTCAIPTNDCNTYAPNQAFYIHLSLANLFNFYQELYQDITNSAVVQFLETINDISDTFKKPEDPLSELYSILGGSLSTVSGLAVFIGDFEFPELGGIGDGIAAIAGIFA